MPYWAEMSRRPLSFKWEQRMNRYSESYGESEKQWLTGRDVASWILPWRRFLLLNFRCSTDTKLPELYRVTDITDTKTNCSHLKAFLVGFSNCDLSRALSHHSFRWNCICTLTLPVIYFYSYMLYIAWLTYDIWD